MANSRPSLVKRNREQAKREKRVEKAARRTERAIDKPPRGEGDIDPDIAGIVAGPQPILED